MVENNYFWIGGKHAVINAYQNKNRKIKEIFLSNQNNSKLLNHSKLIKITKKESIDKIFKDTNFIHQGFAALIEKIENPKLELFLKEKVGQPLTLLILDELQDDRNVGSIIRSSVAFDVDGIVFDKKDFRSRSHEMYKTASGAMEHINIFLVSNLNNAIRTLKENDVWVYALDSESNQNLYEQNFTKKTAFVFGSEGYGIKDLVKKNCNEIIKIPISKKIDSLNVSNTVAAVLTYHSFKHKKTA